MKLSKTLRATIAASAESIADEIISAARASGDDPIAWVTGNAYMPPMRSFPSAESIWQLPSNVAGEAWELLVELVEKRVDDASVALECPDYDNALYAVDTARFEYAEDQAEAAETLQGEWRPIGDVPRNEPADSPELSPEPW
jgi:hypothetical protein